MRAWLAFGAALTCSVELLLACSNDAVDAHDGSTTADGESSDAFVDAPGKDASSDSADFDAPVCDASPTDPRNCGRCGHDCLGGACDAGTCMPWVVVPSPAIDVASDNAFVYWTTGGAAGRVAGCPRVGCDAGIDLVTDAPTPSGVAVDGTNVYYTTLVADGGLAACAKGGCDGGPTILSGGLPFPSRLIVDSNAVFYDVNDSDIFQCTLPSCGNGSGSITMTSQAQGLAQEWNILYWTELRSTIWSCVKGNCQTTRKLIVSNLTSLGAVSAYGGVVFGVQTGANGKILRCPNVPNCTPVVMAQNLDDPSDIETDWTGIYFITRGSNPSTGGQLGFCPQGGCVGAPRVLIDGIAYARSVAIDQDAVYVASGSSILGVAKP